MNPEESRIVQILRKYPEGIQVNSLVVESNIAITSMTGILFELELKGVVKSLAGGMYRLV
jgi:DNA processing protein